MIGIFPEEPRCSDVGFILIRGGTVLWWKWCGGRKAVFTPSTIWVGFWWTSGYAEDFRLGAVGRVGAGRVDAYCRPGPGPAPAALLPRSLIARLQSDRSAEHPAPAARGGVRGEPANDLPGPRDTSEAAGLRVEYDATHAKGYLLADSTREKAVRATSASRKREVLALVTLANVGSRPRRPSASSGRRGRGWSSSSDGAARGPAPAALSGSTLFDAARSAPPFPKGANPVGSSTTGMLQAVIREVPRLHRGTGIRNVRRATQETAKLAPYRIVLARGGWNR